jgi:hypothetical protein
MILQQTDHYVKACMKTWLLCESCIHIEETTSYHPRQSLITRWRSCAHSCFAIVCSIISKENEEMQEPALTCMLSCRECYQECQKYNYIDEIEYCGEVCRYCADIIKDLLIPENLN